MIRRAIKVMLGFIVITLLFIPQILTIWILLTMSILTLSSKMQLFVLFTIFYTPSVPIIAWKILERLFENQ